MRIIENKPKSKQEIKDKKDKDFNIIVTYTKNGKSFQEIAEKILLRKMEEL